MSLLFGLKRHGIELCLAADGGLKIIADNEPTPEIIEAIKANKAALIAERGELDKVIADADFENGALEEHIRDLQAIIDDESMPFEDREALLPAFQRAMYKFGPYIQETKPEPTKIQDSLFDAGRTVAAPRPRPVRSKTAPAGTILSRSDGMTILEHRTGSGNKYRLEIADKIITPGQVAILDGEKTSYCRQGGVVCKNIGKNGGCAWIAPDFGKLSRSYPRFHLLTLKAGYESVPDNMAIFHKLQLVERLLGNILVKLSGLYVDLSREKSYLIACGDCRTCKGKACAVGVGGKCVNPRSRRYSMEACGINVEATLEQELGIKLLWYCKGSGVLPDYMTRACGVLTHMSADLCRETLTAAIERAGYEAA